MEIEMYLGVSAQTELKPMMNDKLKPNNFQTCWKVLK